MERIRERVTGGFATKKTIKISNGTATRENYAGVKVTKTIQDTLTPNFTALLKCGQFLPLNPVRITTATETRVSSGDGCKIWPNYNPGYIYFDGDVGGTSFFTSSYCPPWPTIGDNDGLINAAVVAARSNAVSDTWDVLTFMAEFRKSVETLAQVTGMFWRTSEKLANTAQQIARQRGKLRKAAYVYDIFRDLWLTGRYGIRPMVYDAADITNAIRKLMNGQGNALITGKGYQQETTPPVTEIKVDQLVGGDYRERVTWNLLVKTDTYRSKAYVETDGSWDEAFQANVLTTAWELTTASFIFDWFVDVGAWLNQVTPMLTGGFAGTSVSIKTTATNRSLYEVLPDGNGRGTGGNATVERKIEEYMRFPYSGTPYPPVIPRLSIPKIVDLFTISVKGRANVNKILARR